MADEEFTRALESTQEVGLTVTGRKSGREITNPVWFVQEGGRIYLLPVTGSDSDWYKNVLREPAIRLAARGTQVTARAKPVGDPAGAARVVDMFRGKYGDDNVDQYYPKRNVAVEVPLGTS
jgi:deazaflavin-dependent oxidoreductase (nitroreductase family)